MVIKEVSHMNEFIKGRLVVFTLFLAAALSFTGCQTMQGALNRTKEVFGVKKRTIMVGEVRDARSSMEGVKAQFQSAMEQFRSLVTSSQGALDKRHKILKAAYEKTEKKAADIQGKIDAVKIVAEELFTEWETQLDQYTSDNLRRGSEQRLQEARNQTVIFINAMTGANEKAGPVLAAFSELVLFSSHDLNAESIEAISNEMLSVEQKHDSLIKGIDLSMSEADRLVDLMMGTEMDVNGTGREP